VCGERAPQENAQRDSQRGEACVREPEEPAWDLDLCREPDPEAGSDGGQQRPPAAENQAEHEAAADQDRNEDALVIGTRPRPLESS
jgi:hypothetical protein